VVNERSQENNTLQRGKKVMQSKNQMNQSKNKRQI